MQGNTVHGKILEGENIGESLLMKQMARKILANLLAGLQLFHCIYMIGAENFSELYTIRQNFPLPNFSHVRYLDIAREGGFQSSFHPPFDPTFDLKVVQHNTPVIYIVDLITFTCGIEFTIF